MKPLARKFLIGIVVLPIGAVAGPWVYINLIKEDAPDQLRLEPAAQTAVETTIADTTSTVDGTWAIATDSIVGYRVKEVIVAQSTEGVGRTSAVQGKCKRNGSIHQ